MPLEVVLAQDAPEDPAALEAHTHQVPHLELEDIGGEADALTPKTLSMSKEQATVVHSGIAFETSTWAQIAAAYADPYAEAARRYNPATLREGFNTLPDGEELFYIANPALGLWAERGKFAD